MQRLSSDWQRLRHVLTTIRAGPTATADAAQGSICERNTDADANHDPGREEDEAFYILDGEVEFEIDGVVATATPGTFAFVARGAAHTFRVRTETARMLVICSGKPSANLEDFFLGMGEPATARVLLQPAAPDLDRLDALTAPTGIELV
jgi:mannose-6-phosphate isomerase-like protein (cupin superfamily)